MHAEILGWPEDGPTLRLDYRQFGYAGKFVMSSTGKAVLHERESPVGDPAGGVPASTNGQDDADAFPGRDSDEYATDVVAAVAFSEDRTDSDVLWLRYVTVRADRRGDGLGPRLLAFVRDRARDRGYERLRIAVNNPYSYEALYKTGFAYTGRETGIAELVLEHPVPATPDPEAAASDDAQAATNDDADAAARRYHEGLAAFADRDDLSTGEREFLAEKRERGPPAVEQ